MEWNKKGEPKDANDTLTVNRCVYISMQCNEWVHINVKELSSLKSSYFVQLFRIYNYIKDSVKTNLPV